MNWEVFVNYGLSFEFFWGERVYVRVWGVRGRRGLSSYSRVF